MTKEKTSRHEKFFQIAQVVENWNPLILELKQWAVFARDLREAPVGAIL